MSRTKVWRKATLELLVNAEEWFYVRSFFVADHLSSVFPAGSFILIKDNWDDYWYRTSYQLYYKAESFTPDRIGMVKIAHRGQKPDCQHTELPREFSEQLPEEFFSLGTDQSYYEKLADQERFPDNIGLQALRQINDVAADLGILGRCEDEGVFKISLLRDISMELVRNHFNRIAHGRLEPTPFIFTYVQPQRKWVRT